MWGRQQCVRGRDRSLCRQEQGLKTWNLWVVNGGDCRREWRKLVSLVESRVDAEVIEGLSGLLLSLRAVYVYDIPSVDLEQELNQLVPMYCHFRGILST